jgi:Ca2+-transporting ATPase
MAMADGGELIILATGIGFWFEVKANRAFDVLNQVNDEDLVQVVREGKVTEIAKREVVVGDIVMLNTGNEIPADGELIEAVALQVNESTLTGEPIIKKSTNPEEFDKEATYPTNQVLRGTTVVEGHGIFRVLNVGDKTENGKVFTAAQIDNSVKTPLNHQLDGLGKVITKVSYVLAAIILVGRTITYLQGVEEVEFIGLLANFLQTFMIAVTLIVVTVPEGLPMSVTVSLALSMRKMLKTNNLVRKLHACETMGATTVICTDKTGTLTQNKMEVVDATFYDDSLQPYVILNVAVNSTAELEPQDDGSYKVIGNPTEGALLKWITAQGHDYHDLRENTEVISQKPFSTETKQMDTTISHADTHLTLIKGTPEILHSQ